MEFESEGPKVLPCWINGHAYLSIPEAFFDVSNPATGEVIRRVPLCGATEAAEAVGAAKAAQPVWADMGMPARRVCLAGLAEALDGYAGHFAKLVSAECGFDEARAMTEVEEAIAALQGTTVGQTGVLGLVLDASRPLASFAELIAPAVMAGATVVVKPSPKAPSAVFALCELASRVEWPGGVLNLLQGDSAAIAGLCAAGIDRLVYGGNATLGAQVGTMANVAGVPFEMTPA